VEVSSHYLLRGAENEFVQVRVSLSFIIHTLCPEGAENMSLGSQVPDLCF
jgi:hypothetical protein